MDKLLSIIADIDLPSAYDHFAKNESPNPPFIVFLTPESNNFSADGKVYYHISEAHIELYTDIKNPETERIVEDVLDAHDVFYDKSEVWIESEQLYEVLYSFDLEG